MANAWRSLRHPVGLIPSLGKVRDVVEPVRVDLQLRQLRAIRAHYDGPAGPDVLVFGDSSMLWRSPSEAEKRSLAALLTEELAPDLTVDYVVGNAYNPRLVRAFVTAFAHTTTKPRAVVVPTAVGTAVQAWLTNPDLGYETTAAELIKTIEAGGRTPRHLPKPSAESWEAFDRQRAPSFVGDRRTLGESRFIVNAVPANAKQRPTTKWQHIVRMRHLVDFTNAEALTPDSPGVRIVGELATTLRDLGIAPVAFVAPVNWEMINKLVRKDVTSHIAANETLIAEAFAGEHRDTAVVKAALVCPESEFGDAVHLNGPGRLRIAPLLAAAIRTALGT